MQNTDIWVQVHDLPRGMWSENILANIGNFVGKVVKLDPANLTGGRKPYAHIRITMYLNKPIKRGLKINREGGEWSWVNFNYERLSTFCFVCGLMGHSERDCSLVYANPD